GCWSVAIWRPSVLLHILAVLSELTVTKPAPSGENVAHKTGPEWFLSVLIVSPAEAISQIRAALSPRAAITNLPSGENADSQGTTPAPPWYLTVARGGTSSVASSWPSTLFHTRAVESELSVRMRRPSGENVR